MLTYGEIVNKLEDKRNLLINTLANMNVNTDNIGLLHLIDIMNNVVSDTPYFITTKKEISFVMRGSGTITFIDENGSTVDEVLLRNYDETSISLSLPNDKNNLVFIDGLDNVTELDLHDCGLLRLNINYNETIKTLKIYNNHLEDIDVTGLKALQYFHIYNNPIVENCLSTAFTQSDKWENFPVVNTQSSSYIKLLDLMKQLEDRTNDSLGSVVLYPWYELETLIYESDGHHYKTPDDWGDFIDNPTDDQKLSAGIICKYPRRLRFISKSTTNNYISDFSNIDAFKSLRTNPGEWYTDQPLSEVIYTSDNTTDTLRSFNTVIDGVEFENDSNESILYAFVRGYDIDDSSKNSDIKDQVLDYYTFDKNLNKTRHVLTFYNELRKCLEKDCTINKNWFFGSDIQNTEDFAYCDSCFIESGVHHIWESAQKGFGRVWGVRDLIAGVQPNWNKMNVVRFSDVDGNVADQLGVNTLIDGKPLLGKVYFPDFRLKCYNGSSAVSASYSSKIFGHGDGIVAQLLSHGKGSARWVVDNDIEHIKQFGICPNASGYLVDYTRNNTKWSSSSNKFVSRSLSSSSYVAPFHEMYRFCDAVSNSFEISSSDVNDAWRYASGKFGERRFSVGSSGNDGDGFGVATMNHGKHVFLGTYKETDSDGVTHTYPSTSFLATATCPGETLSWFPSTGMDLIKSNLSFSDYITSVGCSINKFAAETLGLDVTQGTSQSSPNVAGMLILMQNIYKLIDSDYPEEPQYSSLSKKTSDINLNRHGLISGGFGKFSVFMDYVKNNWMHRPSNCLQHAWGIGMPSFNCKPSKLVNSNKISYNKNITTKVGDVITPFDESIDNTIRYVLAKEMKPISNSFTTANSEEVKFPNFIFDYALINDENCSKIMPVVPKTNELVVCDATSAWGDKQIVRQLVNTDELLESVEDKKDSNGNWMYGNTYHYYNLKIKADKPENPLSMIPNNLELILDDETGEVFTNNSSNSYTIQLKIRWDESCFPGDVEPSNMPSYNPVLMNFGILDNNHYYSSIELANSGYQNDAYLSSKTIISYSKIHNKKSLVGYKSGQTLTTTYYTGTSTRAGTNLIRLRYLNMDQSHIYTFVVHDNICKVYVNGTLIRSNSIFNYGLDKVRIDGNVVPSKLEELKSKLDKNILIYDRILTDYEIAHNSAYLLQED